LLGLPGRPALLATMHALIVATAFGLVLMAGQLRVSSPYLDVVTRYQSGDYARAIDEMRGFSIPGLSDRAERDLLALTCQQLTGIADCPRAQASKPVEFARVLEAWDTMIPPAAVVHIDTALSAQIAGRFDAAEAHRAVAWQLADWLTARIPADAPGREKRLDVQRRVWLVSLWLQQLRLDLVGMETPLARARQAYPGDALVALTVGSLHELRARPHVLVDASRGRQGNLATWRREEREFRLDNAAAAYREALALDKGLAEAHLRLGRVLALQRKFDEALSSLARVAETTEDRRLRYIAVMFEASISDSRGKPEAARKSYDEALRLWPGSQAASLAISLALAGAGDWDGAQKRLGPPPQDDPWWAYGLGQAWRIQSEIDALRRVVSR
jgi:tetratricopeptide (TPR) repeat protein